MTNLMKSLPIVAKMLGDKLGVKVEIGNFHPQTDGETIYLPAMPVDDPRTEILMRGFIDHEAAHVRFKSGTLSGTPLEAALQNILEDIRIEQAMGRAFPGAKQNLERLANQLVSEQRFERLSEDAHPGAVVQAFLLHRMRADVLGQRALDDLAADSERRFHETFSPGKATRIEALARTAADCCSVDEIKQLVTRILQSLQEDEDENDETPDSSSASDEQEKGESSSDTGESPDDGSDQMQDDEAEAESPAGSSSEPVQSDPVARALDAKPSDLSDDVGQMLADELSSASSQSDDRVRMGQDVAGLVSRDDYLNDTHWGIDEQRARRATNALRSRLHGLIQSTRLKRQPPRRSGRLMDTSRIARVACGDTRIFRAQREAPGVNTAIHLLLDRSASMDDMMQLACETLFASALALESISRVSVETCVFPVRNSDVATLTPFGKRVVASDYAVRSAGGTPMAEALWHVAGKLAARSESRKMAIVITDGAPSCRHTTCEIVEMMADAGIEVIGIGIGTMSVATLFPKSEVIASVDELPAAVFALLEQPLLRHSA